MTGALHTVGRDPQWLASANCAGTDPESFYLDLDGPPGRRRYSAAVRATCANCPVRVECLEDAIATDDVEWGYRGGMGAKRRKALRDARRDPADTAARRALIARAAAARHPARDEDSEAA